MYSSSRPAGPCTVPVDAIGPISSLPASGSFITKSMPPIMIHTETIPHFAQSTREEIVKALKELLSHKHLYQSIKVDVSFVQWVATNMAAEANSRRMPNMRAAISENYLPTGEHVLSWPWRISGPIPKTALGVPRSLVEADGICFDLPTIHTSCPHCEKVWPFNPVSFTQESGLSQNDNGSFCPINARVVRPMLFVFSFVARGLSLH